MITGKAKLGWEKKKREREKKINQIWLKLKKMIMDVKNKHRQNTELKKKRKKVKKATTARVSGLKCEHFVSFQN